MKLSRPAFIVKRKDLWYLHDICADLISSGRFLLFIFPKVKAIFSDLQTVVSQQVIDCLQQLLAIFAAKFAEKRDGAIFIFEHFVSWMFYWLLLVFDDFYYLIWFLFTTPRLASREVSAALNCGGYWWDKNEKYLAASSKELAYNR